MLFAHLKRILKLGRLRLRGPCGAQDEFTLAATAQNLHRLAKFVARPPPPQPMACAYASSADASTPNLLASASANQPPRNGLADRLRPAIHRLLQRNPHRAAAGECPLSQSPLDDRQARRERQRREHCDPQRLKRRCCGFTCCWMGVRVAAILQEKAADGTLRWVLDRPTH